MSTLPPNPKNLSVAEAWQPISQSDFGPEEAAHLLRRLAFSASPQQVESNLQPSVTATLQVAFEASQDLPKSEALLEFESTAASRHRTIYRDTKDPEERRKLRRALQREETQLFNEYAVAWFHHARAPANSAREKFVLFLQDNFVVERRNIQSTPQLYALQQTLRAGIDGKYPDLCKQVSRQPAMVRYLNLQENTLRKPNENFARELFELFTLGEGNYSERDIKEAARAFTGYQVQNHTEFALRPRQHDSGDKTIFGQTGPWTGDDVIDLVFQQPAARTYLIGEMCKFYLSAEPPHPDYLEALGDLWAEQDFDIQFLIDTFFQSQLFFHPSYRGNLVKSPIQFYLGLCQDLHLDVVPFDTVLLRSMRAMGQSFYDPPNVRGWLYHEHWINATTISARRSLVDYLFSPLNEKSLNGNEQRDLAAAREAGKNRFLVEQKELLETLKQQPKALSDHILTYWITPPLHADYRQILKDLFQEATSSEQANPAREVFVAILQSPAYNLC